MDLFAEVEVVWASSCDTVRSSCLGDEIKDFLKRGAAKRLHLEQLPGYAPDLNPDGGIWNYLKRVELGNVCCSDLAQLRHKLIQAKERLRHKKEIVKSCFRKSGLLRLVP
jgi:transposase